LPFSNGMAEALDNSTLIVAESYGSKLTTFEIVSGDSPDQGETCNRPATAGFVEPTQTEFHRFKKETKQ